MSGQRIGGPRHISREEHMIRHQKKRLDELEAKVRELSDAVEQLRAVIAVLGG